MDGRELVARYGEGSGPEAAHNVYSVTKSVMSMLVGIAISTEPALVELIVPIIFLEYCLSPCTVLG